MQNSQMGTHTTEKQKKGGRPRTIFIKDAIPTDKDSDKYKYMVDFLNEFNITPEEYGNYLETSSDISITSNSNTTATINEEQ